MLTAKNPEETADFPRRAQPQKAGNMKKTKARREFLNSTGFLEKK